MVTGILAFAVLILCILVSVTSVSILEECINQCTKLHVLNKTRGFRDECYSDINQCIQKCYPSKQTDRFVSISKAMCDVSYEDWNNTIHCTHNKEIQSEMKDVCLLDSGLKTRVPDLDNFKTYNWKVLCRAYKINRDCVVPFLRSKCGDKAAERTIAELMIHFTMYEAIVENELNMEWPQDCRDLASAGVKQTFGSICLIMIVLVHFRSLYSFMRIV